MATDLYAKPRRRWVPTTTIVIVLSAIILAELSVWTLGMLLDYHAPHIAIIVALTCILVATPICLFFAYKIHRLKALAFEASNLAKLDDLTGLLIRRPFMKQMQDHLEKKGNGILAYIDADHFKSINDGYGHHVGDDILKEISRRLAAVSNEGRISARIGGEEFALFFPNNDFDKAIRIANEVLESIRGIQHPALSEGRTISASIGIAVYAQGEAMQDLLQRADTCLYGAKKAGRDMLMTEQMRLAA